MIGREGARPPLAPGDRERRIILIDGETTRGEVLAGRLRTQGFTVEHVTDAAVGAEQALSAPPAAVVADLWMPGISGVQLCRLLRSEASTMEVPIVLRGDEDDPRARFWAERAGAFAFVPKGRVGELVRVLHRAAAAAPASDGFFIQLSGGSVDIRDRIAQHLDEALFEFVIAAEVRALASACSIDQLFDKTAQLASQLLTYRWLALVTGSPPRLAIHTHPEAGRQILGEVRAALDLEGDVEVLWVEDEDAKAGPDAHPPVVRSIPFGDGTVGHVAVAPFGSSRQAEQLTSLLARDLGGPLRIATLLDESHRLATIDSLTSLLNRRAFRGAMDLELARAGRWHLPLALMLLDVDHFKSINDRFGHATGDRVLAAIGAALRREIRSVDVAARWGGEEFVVALANTSLADATGVAERIRCALEEIDVTVDDVRVPISASIGLTVVRDADDLDALVERADHAMYGAKSAGRNRVVVCDEDRSASQAPIALRRAG